MLTAGENGLQEISDNSTVLFRYVTKTLPPPILLSLSIIGFSSSQFPSLDVILSQLNPLHSLAPYLSNIHFNIIFSATPRSPFSSLPFVRITK
jgi:hypothetical protein